MPLNPNSANHPSRRPWSVVLRAADRSRRTNRDTLLHPFWNETERNSENLFHQKLSNMTRFSESFFNDREQLPSLILQAMALKDKFTTFHSFHCFMVQTEDPDWILSLHNLKRIPNNRTKRSLDVFLFVTEMSLADSLEPSESSRGV